MPKKIIHSSEIQVLAHLLSSADINTIVFDPDNKLCVDDDSPFPVAKRMHDLQGMAFHKDASKLCVVNISRQALLLPEADFVIEFTSDNEYEKKRKICWQYICNPNGTIRWLFPASIRKPWFLAFYNFNYWKARIYKFVVNIAFLLRLPKFISNGTITIHANQPIHVEELLSDKDGIKKDFSIFTGTTGVNRKAILAVAPRKKILYFYKIALNGRSRRNIRNEYQLLHQLQSDTMGVIKIPKSVSINGNTIRLTNIKPDAPIAQQKFGDKHALFLNHLYEISLQQERFMDLPLFKETEKKLLRISSHPKLSSIPFAAGLFEKLQSLQQQLKKENPMLAVGICHGDFTRWNCYEDDLNIYVYDWELGRPAMPLLFDLFHYVIQGAVFASNPNPLQIQHLINDTLENSFVKKMVEDYDINPAFQLQLYLLLNASYYLDIYLDQQSIHREVPWLFRTWGQLLVTETQPQEGDSQRKKFMKSFFHFMDDKQYAMLKNAGKKIAELSYTSDVDLLIRKADLASILKWTKANENVQKVKISKKSFMTTVQIFFNDISFLSIDLLNAFNRKSIQYIDSDLLISNTVIEGNIKMLPTEYDYLYIFLFYQINYSDVPEKYASLFRGLKPEQEQRILGLLNANTGIEKKSVLDTFEFSSSMRNGIYQFLKSKRENNMLKRGLRRIRYGLDLLKGFSQNRGVMLTFSGVDGAGKSTILAEIKEMLEKKYRKKVVVIRHRPSMLPILSALKYGKEAAEQRCVDSLPRKGTNKSILSSLFRFAYYYTDYLFGQFVVYAKYILRGYIVLYDRYYFDFIVDGKRSNIVINKGFIKSLYRLVYKPELNVFLYAQPEVILKRKKELSAKDITELTINYKYLFNQLGDSPQYMCIENIDKATTISKIEQAFIQLN